MSKIKLLIPLLFVFTISGCNNDKDVIFYDYLALEDTYGKTEDQIRLDYQILIRKFYIDNKHLMPEDLFSVKYTEKHRWRKLLELLKDYKNKDFDLILKIERAFDSSKVGITIEGDMYYNYGYCPEDLNSDYTCSDDYVFVYFKK